MMGGPGRAFILVSLQVVAGTFVSMWIAQLRWKFINRGYYRSTTWVLWPLTAALAPLLAGSLRFLDLVAASCMLLFLLAVYSQRPLLEWVTGGLASAASVWLVLASARAFCADDCGVDLAHAVVGMILMGSVTHAMVLGHWYLNQARLPIEPLAHHTWTALAAVGISAALGLATRGSLSTGTVAAGLLAFSSSSYWWAWLLLLLTTAGLGAMILATVKQRATQSATGLLYIAIVTALGAQFLLNLLVLS